LIEGFERQGSSLGALLPGEESVFRPFAYTPDLREIETEPARLSGARLARRPLETGGYVISVTALDLAQNAATEAVLVAVQSGE